MIKLRAARVNEDLTVALPGGRRLGYREFGGPAGVPVIALHGTPGSRLKFADSDGVASRLGLRLVSVDRWGYGLSSRAPRAGAKLTDFGADMVALADALGVECCLVNGVSGGGPFAIAAAAALAQRCIGLALVSPIGVIDAATKLSPFHALCFRVLPYWPRSIAAIFQLYRTALWLAPDSAMRLALAFAPPIDKRTIGDVAIRKRLIATFTNGLAPGVSGAVTDLEVFARPWDIDLAALSTPVRIWIGSVDRNVPQDGVRRLAEAITASELVMIEGAGHLWIATHGGEVMGWLAQTARLPLAGPIRSQPRVSGGPSAKA